jgi:hypothetical protein
MTQPAAPIPPVADGDPACALDRARALIEPQLRLLGRLAEIGLDAAEAIGRQVRGEEPAGKTDPSLAFARASRAVRLTVALQSKLIDALAALEAGRVGPDAAVALRDPDYLLKARIERIVERTAEAEHQGDDDAVDRLVREAGDRLDDIDLYGDLLDRPVSEILCGICRDLDLPLDWARLAQEAWAQAEMSGGEAGAPLAALIEILKVAPQPEGPHRAARLAANARRGRRCRPESGPAPPQKIEYDVCWMTNERGL